MLVRMGMIVACCFAVVILTVSFDALALSALAHSISSLGLVPVHLLLRYQSQ